MHKSFIHELLDNKLLCKQELSGKEFLSFCTPCSIQFPAAQMSILNSTYKPDEELGGLMWAKPVFRNGQTIYEINKISWIKNAIDQYPNKGDRTIHNAYWPDPDEYRQYYNEIILQKYLPVSFHTHPCPHTVDVSSLLLQFTNFDTSEKDIIESKLKYKINGQELLTPRVLIVKTSSVSKDIFVGVYGGFVAKESFSSSIKKVQEENLKKIADTLSTIELADKEKIALGIGGLLLLLAAFKYTKYSLPVIAALGTSIPFFLANTKSHENPEYFNKVSTGEINIHIPHVK